RAEPVQDRLGEHRRLRIAALLQPAEKRVGHIIEGLQSSLTCRTPLDVVGEAFECRPGKVSQNETRQFRAIGATGYGHEFVPAPSKITHRCYRRSVSSIKLPSNRS